MNRPIDKPEPTGYDEYLRHRVQAEKVYEKRKKGAIRDAVRKARNNGARSKKGR